MRKSLLLIATMLLALTATAKKPSMKDVSRSLVGVWQLIILEPATGSVKTNVPFIKIINSDGTYVHMYAGGGPAFFNAVGEWKVTSQSTFLEFVKPSSTYEGRTEEQTFEIKVKDGVTYMHSKFYTVGKENMQVISEVWKKCSMPPSLKK